MDKSTKILVIDDTPGVAELVSQVVQYLLPYAQVLIARDAQQGLILALHHYPILIITELDMAEMDGYEMLRILRNEKNSKQARVIGMTTNGKSTARVKQFRLVCNDFLFKPFSLDEIRQKVAAVLGLEYPPGRARPLVEPVQEPLKRKGL